MSLLFSEITYKDRDGRQVKLWESGHPDEHDLRELLKYEARYAEVKEAARNGAVIRVRHYYFRGSGGEWLAEQDHISLIDAYDELAEKYGIPGFTGRKDVELQEEYKFQLKDAKTKQK